MIVKCTKSVNAEMNSVNIKTYNQRIKNSSIDTKIRFWNSWILIKVQIWRVCARSSLWQKEIGLMKDLPMKYGSKQQCILHIQENNAFCIRSTTMHSACTQEKHNNAFCIHTRKTLHNNAFCMHVYNKNGEQCILHTYNSQQYCLLHAYQKKHFQDIIYCNLAGSGVSGHASPRVICCL